MPNDFASTLIALRGEKNLTQQQLGDAAGVSPSQISRYESGLAIPRKTVLLKLAKVLGVSENELKRNEAEAGVRIHKGFTTRLVTARHAKGMRIADLAKASGLPAAVLEELELGDLLPLAEDVVALSAALDIPVSELAGTRDEEEAIRLRLVVADEDDNEISSGTHAMEPEVYRSFLAAAESYGLPPEAYVRAIVRFHHSQIFSPDDGTTMDDIVASIKDEIAS